MKNPKTILTALFAVAVLVTVMGGCKKTETNPTPTRTPLIKTITNNPLSQSNTISYNSQGKQTNFSDTYYPVTYTYSSNSVMRLEEDLLSGISHITTFTLGSNGVATSGVMRRSDGAATNYLQYTYDADGHLTQETNTDSATSNVNYTRTYTWSNGNLTSMHEVSGSNSLTNTYTYITDRVSTIENANMGLNWLGKGNTNVIQSENDGSVTSSYSYTFDSEGKVLTKKDASNGATLLTYTYN